MNGFDKEKAATFILSRIDPRLHRELDDMEKLVRQAIDADLAFMKETGVLDENGNEGENCYDDDEAFEFILDRLVSLNQLDDEKAMQVASLLDDYMDAQQLFMEEEGLASFE